MSLLKIPVSVSARFLPSGLLQQYRITAINFLKTKPLNVNVRKNHIGHVNSFDSNIVQKYLKFLENDNSDKISSKAVQSILELLRTKRNADSELKSLEEMSHEGSKELEELIEKDKEILLSKISSLKEEIMDLLIPVDDDDNRNVELQVVPNIGGEEARLFSKELFDMYFNYVNYKNWEHIVDYDSSYLYISGDNIFGHLKYETGIHRVQRVPETEAMGRTHTSTCSVLVLPQPRPNEVVFNEKEIIIETMRSSGPGGQNVNKTESCVRVTHKPTGIVVENQTSRFQYENKKIAIERLRGIIFNMKQKEFDNKVLKVKKKHMNTNIYSDKIRTYNYNQNRITDHRIQFSVHNIKGFLTGARDLDRMIRIVKEHLTQQKLKEHIQEVLESDKYKKYESQNPN